MKFCSSCRHMFEEKVMSCQKCGGPLREVSLQEVFELTEKAAFQKRIGGRSKEELPDAYKQYHIRCYLQNRSLFLDYDLHKNRLKHGRRLKRFFVAPVNLISVFNLPWFLFNVIMTNLFHMHHVAYCVRCDAKTGLVHSREECDYNIEYFSILDDILTGRVVDRKPIYEQYAKERRDKGLHSAYDDLFHREIRWEVCWDLVSIWCSVLFWLYLLVFISLPWCRVLMQEMDQWKTFEPVEIEYSKEGT